MMPIPTSIPNPVWSAGYLGLHHLFLLAFIICAYFFLLPRDLIFSFSSFFFTTFEPLGRTHSFIFYSLRSDDRRFYSLTTKQKICYRQREKERIKRLREDFTGALCNLILQKGKLEFCLGIRDVLVNGHYTRKICFVLLLLLLFLLYRIYLVRACQGTVPAV
ncbi:hypothetical protein QBC44DRAFT_81531 [Cladorrhinum sp. PSN332]|nr:hypothetical protein QBC44DRAFT_81531 [Cladorrhinum sp. PSN332]